MCSIAGRKLPRRGSHTRSGRPPGRTEQGRQPPRPLCRARGYPPWERRSCCRTPRQTSRCQFLCRRQAHRRCLPRTLFRSASQCWCRPRSLPRFRAGCRAWGDPVYPGGGIAVSGIVEDGGGAHLIGADPQILLLHQGAVLLIDDAPGAGRAAGVGVLLGIHLSGAPVGWTRRRGTGWWGIQSRTGCAPARRTGRPHWCRRA